MAEENKVEPQQVTTEPQQVTKEPQQVTHVTKEPQQVTTKNPKKVRGWLRAIVRREKQRKEKNNRNWRKVE